MRLPECMGRRGAEAECEAGPDAIGGGGGGGAPRVGGGIMGRDVVGYELLW